MEDSHGRGNTHPKGRRCVPLSLSSQHTTGMETERTLSLNRPGRRIGGQTKRKNACSSPFHQKREPAAASRARGCQQKPASEDESEWGSGHRRSSPLPVDRGRHSQSGLHREERKECHQSPAPRPVATAVPSGAGGGDCHRASRDVITATPLPSSCRPWQRPFHIVRPVKSGRARVVQCDWSSGRYLT